MKLSVSKGFEKSLYRLKDKTIQKKLATVVIAIETASTLSEIPNVKKMAGFAHFYRVRIGSYRLGFSCQDDEVILLYVGHRKDIYDSFP